MSARSVARRVQKWKRQQRTTWSRATPHLRRAVKVLGMPPPREVGAELLVEGKHERATCRFCAVDNWEGRGGRVVGWRRKT